MIGKKQPAEKKKQQKKRTINFEEFRCCKCKAKLAVNISLWSLETSFIWDQAQNSSSNGSQAILNQSYSVETGKYTLKISSF